MTEERLKIAIADDHQLVRDSLSELIRKKLYADVVVQASNGSELIKSLVHNPVDMVLLDINMPEMDGIETLRELKTRNSKIKVIVLTMYDDESLLMKLVRLKVSGFLLKTSSSKELITAIKEVASNGYYFNQKLVKMMFKRTYKIGEYDQTEQYFSPDPIDLEILKHLCEERTSKEIGDLLSFSARTVEGRKRKMIESLGLKNQVGLAMYAIKVGWVKLS